MRQLSAGLSEEELLIRAREERANIVGRYDLGREEGAVIDPWEDPEFEVYHSTDRYGFIQYVMRGVGGLKETLSAVITLALSS